MKLVHIVLAQAALTFPFLAGCKAFVPERAFVNGGRVGERQAAVLPTGVQMGEQVATYPEIPLVPTETTLRWASRGGDVLDREMASNAATVYYGHKEKPPKQKPEKLPLLVFTKTVRDGSRECHTLLYDKPPPASLLYRLRVTNVGSGEYDGRLEIVDQLPDEVTYLGIKAVHDRKLTYVPYIGMVETKHELAGWHVEPQTGGKGTRVEWSMDNVELKAHHWITIDIEFEPPPFESAAPED